MRKTKTVWLNEGLLALSEKGVNELAIERMTARLGVTKGSFYHHFNGQQGFKMALLEFVENIGTTGIIERVERATSPLDKLNTLLESATSGSVDYERAIRAWALQDEDVRQFQLRIDQLRLEYTYQLCAGVLVDELNARTLANMLYAILIGCEQIHPTFDAAYTRHLLKKCVAQFMP